MRDALDRSRLLLILTGVPLLVSNLLAGAWVPSTLMAFGLVGWFGLRSQPHAAAPSGSGEQLT